MSATTTVSAIVYTTGQGANTKKAKSITNISTTATPAQICAFTQALVSSLSTRTYAETYRVEKTLCDTAGGNNNG